MIFSFLIFYCRKFKPERYIVTWACLFYYLPRLHLQKGPTPGPSSKSIRKHVNDARQVQRRQFRQYKSVYSNARMPPPRLTKQYCHLDSNSTGLLHQSIERLGLSARAYYRILKIARTIADLDRSGDPYTPCSRGHSVPAHAA